jgi:hypothetical protein
LTLSFNCLYNRQIFNVSIEVYVIDIFIKIHSFINEFPSTIAKSYRYGRLSCQFQAVFSLWFIHPHIRQKAPRFSIFSFTTNGKSTFYKFCLSHGTTWFTKIHGEKSLLFLLRVLLVVVLS